MGSPANRRQHPRVTGPFDAYRLGIFDTPLQIYDLSVGGCFINDFHDPPPPGKTFPIKIELPEEEPLTLQVQAVYGRPGFGYAVQFCELSDEARTTLERALTRIQTRGY